jgi:hypothetical protein
MKAECCENEFVAMAKASGWRLGVGGADLPQRDGKLVKQWAADHTQCVTRSTLILALNIYKHS